MANTKSRGKKRRDEVDEDENEDAAMNGDTDNEIEDEAAARQRRKDKGKGRATSQRPEDEPAVQDDDEEQEHEAGDAQEADGEGVNLDEEQDINEKRDIRKQYRDLTGAIKANHERNPDAMTAGELRATLEKANKLFKGVRAPAEAVLDSNFLMMTGDMAMYQARKVKVGADYFDTDDFINKLKASISGPIRTAADAGSSKKKKGVKRQSDDEDEQDPDYDGVVVDPYSGWDKIGKLATKHSLRVPPVDFMLGPLAIPQKKKVVKKRQARERNDPGERVRPQEIGEDDIQHDENATSILVKQVADILEEKGGESGMNLFEFIINPESYTQTIENIFYTSFLIKERRAAIDYDDDGEPIIYASLPPDDEQKAEAEIKARQLIFEMDMQMWKDAIEAYGIKETVIPTRRYQTIQSGRWYG